MTEWPHETSLYGYFMNQVLTPSFDDFHVMHVLFGSYSA